MQGQNHLWLNEGGKRFRDATPSSFPKTPWGAMGVKAFDFDGGGRFVLLVTDMPSDMWVNIPPGDWAAEGRKADSARALADFFPTGKSRFIFGNALFHNRGGGRFDEVSDAAASPVMEQRVAEDRSEEHTSELQSQSNLVCRLLLEKKK